MLYRPPLNDYQRRVREALRRVRIAKLTLRLCRSARLCSDRSPLLYAEYRRDAEARLQDARETLLEMQEMVNGCNFGLGRFARPGHFPKRYGWLSTEGV